MTNVQQFFRVKLPIFSFGQNVPLFQFAIFYNMDMEICPGASMFVNGKTYVDGNVWADPSSGATLTFADTMETTSNIFYTRNPNDPQASTPNPSVVYLAPNSPILYAPTLLSQIGTNNSFAALLGLPPPGLDPDSIPGQAYLYNESDIIISNSPAGTNYAFFQDPENINRLTFIPYDTNTVISYLATNGYTTNYITNIVYHPPTHTYTTNITSEVDPITSTAYATNWCYSFVTNTTFYDYREAKTVEAVQLNVGALKSWLSGTGSVYNPQLYNDTGHYLDSIYVYNGAPFSNTNLPAVRVANGTILPPQGLTVATPFPLYVLGNYNASASDLGTTNVADAAPAALLGDAITVLSTSWNDGYTVTTPLTSRNAGSTTVNAATLEGIVPSTTINGVKHYSGGVENFLRLLENWSGDTLTCNGSIVVMFSSRYATNFWQSPGVYYMVPTRNWGFDVNFSNPAKLPPLTPFVTSPL